MGEIAELNVKWTNGDKNTGTQIHYIIFATGQLRQDFHGTEFWI